MYITELSQNDCVGKEPDPCIDDAKAIGDNISHNKTDQECLISAEKCDNVKTDIIMLTTGVLRVIQSRSLNSVNVKKGQLCPSKEHTVNTDGRIAVEDKQTTIESSGKEKDD